MTRIGFAMGLSPDHSIPIASIRSAIQTILQPWISSARRLDIVLGLQLSFIAEK